MRIRLASVTLALAVSFAASLTSADEGMWLINQLPEDYLQKTYGFEPADAWVEHVRLSCIRFGRGGSASFVSPDGLIMTNHHVGSDAIQDLSDAEHDYTRDGFYARTRQEEKKSPGLEVMVLQRIEDVTERVDAAAKPEMTPAEALTARKAAMAVIEKEAEGKTSLYPETVTLYHGERYHLYLYKKYTDLRLVFAPEAEIAFFGGDPENFEYPRYDLDVCFFRAYENDRPAKTEHYLRWSPRGVSEGDLVFMAGHPARTQRLYTVDHLKFLRDVELPLLLAGYNQREVALLQYQAEGDEQRRRVREDVAGIQNGRKAFGGMLAGLLDAGLMARKQESERALRAFVEADPNLASTAGSAWSALGLALEGARSYYPAYYLMESRRMRMSALVHVAWRLLRLAEEREKPDAQRLPEYRDTELESLKIDLLSPAPIYEDLERVKLADALTRLGRMLGGEHPIAITALAGRGPEERAAELLAGTRLTDLEYRRQLFEGGLSAVAGSEDSLIRFVRSLDPLARQLRKRYEDELESVIRDAYARIAKALFAKYGDSVYPDATSSLRLSVGTVKGYQESASHAPAMTTLRGAYELSAKHHNDPPYRLPPRWLERKEGLDLQTPFNFVSTNDIIGGNSGSPVINRDGQIVGIVFDGNIQSLPWDYQFDQTQGRSVSVDVRAIIEALRHIYDAAALAEELLGRQE